MILLDTSGLLAAVDASENFHAVAARSLARAVPRIMSPFVLAEPASSADVARLLSGRLPGISTAAIAQQLNPVHDRI